MTFDRFDVVVLPFPFSDQLKRKNRPVLVLSSAKFNNESNHLVTAMITTAKGSVWPLDVPLEDYADASLPVPCLVRMKFFTAARGLIVKKVGKVSRRDAKAIGLILKQVFAV